jgi:nitrate/nitrite transporter NarK
VTLSPELLRRFAVMLGLILAGETIFALPFHVARFFRPIMLDVFGLSATELGVAQGVYGVVAMIAYFPGGPIADRFPARRLLASSLWITAVGGIYLATFPPYAGMLLLWGVFAVTSILLFWAALIRATRDWGGVDEQGRAYGILDSGRGILAAGMASLGVLALSITFPDGYAEADAETRAHGLRLVIYGYTAMTALAGALVWFAIPDQMPTPDGGVVRPTSESAVSHVIAVLRMPAIWMQAAIVFCAYVAYKGFDNYSLFAVQGYGLDEVEAARVVTIGSWMRPVAALAAGLLGDRFTISRMTVVAFVMLLASDLFFAFTTPIPGATAILLGNILIACAAFFGLRGLYFALFEEAKVPAAMTGTAVGIVCMIGFIPDIFSNWIAGVLVDRSPGLAGHQHYFMFLAAFAALGVVVSWILQRRLIR